MAHAFRRRSDGSVSCRLEQEEKAVIAQIAQETRELVRQDLGLTEEPEAVRRAADSEDPLERLEAELASTSARSPRDPAVRRLLPDASDDPEVAAEMRRLGQHDLATAKTEGLARLLQLIDASGLRESEVSVPAEDVEGVLRSLTDLRLVLAERLGLERDGDFETLRMIEEIGRRVPGAAGRDEESDLTALMAAVYELLTWLQESLLQVLDDGTIGGTVDGLGDGFADGFDDGFGRRR
ncbi:DUF2017 family protein [Brachybacterium sp. EF45031]|uniref:DUF2017 domain-containing protein n=1 Tax=Brachybacterium sillae TaxID=2810536 RepID=UPI00217E25BF|nr:DUF2017 domain-containing protein [Brachybacterium sillae]MCS6710968.1 DUF2017 family protein [Brachybacterium sillae]